MARSVHEDFVEQFGKYGEDEELKTGTVVESTVHPQSASGFAQTYHGSSTVKRLVPSTGVMTNAPIDDGLGDNTSVVNGVVILNPQG